MTLDEQERQTVILALAQLAKQRPGWRAHLEAIVEKFDGRGMFYHFMATEPTQHRPESIADSLSSFPCNSPDCIACQDGEPSRCLRRVSRRVG